MSNNQFTRRSRAPRPTTAKEALTQEPERKKLTIRIDPELHKQFQILAVTTDRTMNDITAELITSYVKQHAQ